MVKILLYVGLVITPFYELLAKALPYVVAIPPDTRVAKLFLAMWFALMIGVAACFSGELRPCRNKWLLLLLVYIPLNISLSPPFDIELNGVLTPSYWVWKPFVLTLCFFLMFMAVQSLNITRRNLETLFKVMVWCGFVMSCYVLIQDFGWEQFYDIRTGGKDNILFHAVTKPMTVGTLGNSTIVSPYIAMLIPLALHLRKYFMAVVMILAVCLTWSMVAVISMVLSLAVYALLTWRSKGLIVILILALVSSAGLSWWRFLDYKHFTKVSSKAISNNGRFSVWKTSIELLKDEKFGAKNKTKQTYTGIGLGSYPFLITPKTGDKFSQAHNEYIETLVTLGPIGLALLLAAIGYMLRNAFFAYLSYADGEVAALLCSFICIAVAAFGTFVWQLAPHNFYTVLIAGLLHNRNLIKGEVQ